MSRIPRELIWTMALAALMPAAGRAQEPVAIKTPRVLWAFKASEHFIAAPVAGKGALYVSGLGAFNSGVFHALAIDPAAHRREMWSLSAPDLRLPVVSSPAIVGDKLFFGSGMHQTDGAVLYCVKADTGRCLWQLPLSGDLVHLEGSPVVAGDRLYIGGGNAGVLAVDISHATLEGKELTLTEVEAILDKRWRELQAKYEEDKRRDPDLAFPPDPAALPKPTPTILWNSGKNHWHIDAGVCLAGERLLVGSAYLDAERQGERALICLPSSVGKGAMWKAPLKYNPWASPVVAGDVVVIAGSSIRLDPNHVAQAKGEITVLNLHDGGGIRWRRDVPGGVVSRCAVQKDLVIFTATDGKVRAFNLRDGTLVWTYDAGNPLFAGAVVNGDTVYTADLKAVVHALSLTNGARRWTFDLASDPAVQIPGMVYGTPLFSGGRLYVATCNIAANDAKRDGAVICLGDN